MSQFEGVYILKKVFSSMDLENALADEDSKKTDEMNVGDNLDYVALFSNARVQNALDVIMGTTNATLRSCVSMKLDRGEDKRAWTVGAPYNNKPTGGNYKKDCNGVRVIIPLTNFKEHCGAPMYVPNSHLARGFPTAERLTNKIFADVDDEFKVFPCKKKYLECEVGDVIVMHGMVWHSRGLNATEETGVCLVGDFIRN